MGETSSTSHVENVFVDMFWTSARDEFVMAIMAGTLMYQIVDCYATSQQQCDAHSAFAHAQATLQAIRAVTMVDGLPGAASCNI